MGGSGGGFSIAPDQLSTLTETAKTDLRESSEPTRQNLFISFATEDLADVNLLRGQAKNASSELDFNDWSLKEPFNSDRAEYIRAGIRDRIRQSSVTLVYVSDATHGSEWVDWEIRESVKLGKRVVAMYKGDSPPAKLPAALVDNGIKSIPWTHDGLMDALKDPQAK
jgi:hypothetical protein